MTTNVRYVPEDRVIDLAKPLADDDYQLITGLHGTIKRGDQVLLCLREGTADPEMTVRRHPWRADRFVAAHFPGGGPCSACGVVKAKLALAERNWTCEGCGALHDRDVNAAINLARLGEHAVGVESRPAGSGPVAGRGAIQKTLFGGARGQETSTLQDQPVRKTGTAPPQGEAALP